MGAARRLKSARFWLWRSNLSHVLARVALAALGLKLGLSNEDFEIFDQVKDKIPAEPPRFE